MGCLPSLYAVSAEEIEGGKYIGPSGVAKSVVLTDCRYLV